MTGPPPARLLVTQRLQLEPLEVTHAAPLFDGLRDEALYEFIPEAPPASVAALAERYRRLAQRVSPDGREAWLNWAVRPLAAGEYAGVVQATVHADRSAHLAYVLFRSAWGQGYASEAVTAMTGHLRADWGAGDLWATVDTRNRRSIALLERLGFIRGVVRIGAEEIRGVPADEVDYFLPAS